MRQRFEQYLSQFVYGAIDGSVTTFAIVAGAAGAGLSSSVIIILGIANLVADGFSMGASAFLATQSTRDMARSENGVVDAVHPPLAVGVATFVAFVLVGFVPILVYVLDALFGSRGDGATLFAISSFLTGAAFMAVGIIKGQTTKTNQLLAGLETLALGSIAAALAYILGVALAAALGTS